MLAQQAGHLSDCVYATTRRTEHIPLRVDTDTRNRTGLRRSEATPGSRSCEQGKGLS